MKKIGIGLLIVATLIGCCARISEADNPLDNVLAVYDVRMIEVNGVTCIIAGSGYNESGAALSCNWGNK